MNWKYLFWIGMIVVFWSCGGTTSAPEPIVDTSPAKSKPEPKVVNTNPEPEKEEPVKSNIPSDYLMGKFLVKQHGDFVRLSTKHASSDNMWLRKEAYEAFVKMYDAAKKDNISLKIISATRPFAHQKRIWEGKWNGQRLVDGKNLSKTIPDSKTRALKILEYSSMPGTSRHHWGTDMDFNNLNNSYFEKGTGLKIYNWLQENAATYGFCQPYTSKEDGRTGYNEEKWHWTYLPISKDLTEAYKEQIKNEDILGFDGDESAVEIDVVKNYVLGIHGGCKH